MMTWERRPATLTKSYHFDTYTEAIEFAQKIDEMSAIMDHHANLKIVHKCVDGVDVELEFFTFEADELTDKDYEAAQAIDTLASGGAINMDDFTYSLDPAAIAIHPSYPRGSSKLVRVDENGNTSFHPNFGESFPSLAAGAHIVFNESRVLDARLFIHGANGKKFEMMILDIGGIDVKSPSKDIQLNVMLRTDAIDIGDILEVVGGGKAKVVGVKG